MNGAEPQKTNNLVQATRGVGLALKSGDMNKLQELAKSIGQQAGGVISTASREKLGTLKSQLPQIARKAGNQSDQNQRVLSREQQQQGRGR